MSPSTSRIYFTTARYIFRKHLWTSHDVLHCVKSYCPWQPLWMKKTILINVQAVAGLDSQGMPCALAGVNSVEHCPRVGGEVSRNNKGRNIALETDASTWGWHMCIVCDSRHAPLCIRLEQHNASLPKAAASLETCSCLLSVTFSTSLWKV